jgi:hypothetical protein
MLGSSDHIPRQPRMREVTGVFHSRTSLIAAAEDLLLSGFDRPDIDLGSSVDRLERGLKCGPLLVDLADTPAAARQPFLDQADALGTTAVIGGISGCTAAVASAFFAIVQDMALLSVGVISVLSGFVVGGAATFMVDRSFRRERAGGLEALSDAYGLLIWVRVRSIERERQAHEILLRHGCEPFRFPGIELAKRTKNIRFAAYGPIQGWTMSGSGSPSFSARPGSRPADSGQSTKDKVAGKLTAIMAAALVSRKLLHDWCRHQPSLRASAACTGAPLKSDTEMDRVARSPPSMTEVDDRSVARPTAVRRPNIEPR